MPANGERRPAMEAQGRHGAGYTNKRRQTHEPKIVFLLNTGEDGKHVELRRMQLSFPTRCLGNA